MNPKYQQLLQDGLNLRKLFYIKVSYLYYKCFCIKFKALGACVFKQSMSLTFKRNFTRSCVEFFPCCKSTQINLHILCFTAVPASFTPQ